MMAFKMLTKSAAAAENLREDISNGFFAPGQRLVLRDLATRYGVSQIPVREALAALARDGLVEIKPHSGASVATVSPNEIREQQFIRSHLEALAVEAATPHLTESDFLQLEVLIQQMESAVAHHDPRAYAALNREFHRMLYAACPYKKLVQIIEMVWHEGSKPMVIFAVEPDHMARSSADHRAILGELKRGNAAQARQLMLDHKFSAANVMLAHLDASEAQAGGRAATSA
jgi:DNA-binding GntR family transcriptional regulator